MTLIKTLVERNVENFLILKTGDTGTYVCKLWVALLVFNWTFCLVVTSGEREIRFVSKCTCTVRHIIDDL